MERYPRIERVQEGLTGGLGWPLSGVVRRGLVGWGLCARRLLAGEPVNRLPDEVGMAVVPRVLLDHVDQDPSQAGCPTVGPGAPRQPLKAALGQRLRDQGAGAGHGVLPERDELLG